MLQVSRQTYFVANLKLAVGKKQLAKSCNVKCDKGECYVVDKIISQRYKRIRIMAGSFRDLTV